MKKAIYLLFVFSLLCISCFPLDNYGYPDLVKFPMEGGTAVISGFAAPSGLSIQPNSSKSSEGDTLICTYEWLTIKNKKGEKSISLVAAPNESGKNRSLFVTGDFGYCSLEIRVIQEK